ncbi:MAG: SH3 domain-containing protein [Spirochaetota bacterium]
MTPIEKPAGKRTPSVIANLSRAGLLCTVFALIACATQDIGTGVVLWSPDESVIESGSVVSVLSESDISDTYEITADTLDEPIEIERWRIDLFAEPEAAQARAAEYAASLEGNTQLYARATRNALPMRSDATPSSSTVYRLRMNEEIKLIGRLPEQTDLGGLVSYWYEALTATGARGWTFGYTLEVFDPTDPSVIVDTGGNTDPLVDLLLQNTWRPMSFIDMISNGAIDLEEFRAEYGLFPDPENNQFELVLPRHATIFEYEAITRVGSRRYVAEGTSLQLTFQRNDELSIQYELDGQQHTLALQRVAGGIDDYIERERERRSRVYQELIERGPEFTSNAYGTLAFLEQQRFNWTGYGRLVPTAIPEGTGTSGRVDLGLFLSAGLMQEFDGALSFVFDGNPTPASFAYTFREGGVRLVWIPPRDIEDRLVLRTTASPLTIFMSSTGE